MSATTENSGDPIADLLPTFAMPLTPRWNVFGRSVSPVPLKAGITFLLIVAALQIPQQLGKSDVNLFSEVLCLAIAAMGVNLLTGFNGQISVGHGAFYGIGAYTSFLLVADHEWSFPMAALAAAVVSFVVGLLVGLPALRIKGLYLAIVTLALAALFPQIVIRFADVTGGTSGMQITKQETPTVYDFNRPPSDSGLQPDQWRFYVIFVVAMVCLLLVRNLVRSRVGRALVATRDNETAAEVVGVALARYKVLTFGISAMLAGIGGAMQVFLNGSVNPSQFGIDLSITILVAVVVGGAATIVGPLVGAFFIEMLPTWLPTDTPQASPVLFGLSLVLLMRVAPGGVVGLARRTWSRLSPKINGPRPGGAPPPMPDDAVTA